MLLAHTTIDFITLIAFNLPYFSYEENYVFNIFGNLSDGLNRFSQIPHYIKKLPEGFQNKVIFWLKFILFQSLRH